MNSIIKKLITNTIIINIIDIVTYRSVFNPAFNILKSSLLLIYSIIFSIKKRVLKPTIVVRIVNIKYSNLLIIVFVISFLIIESIYHLLY